MMVIYHWKARVSAYDSYKQQLLISKREREIASMENKHKTAAEEIFQNCVDFIKDPENLAKMSAKEALDWFKAAAELNRLSLGLHPQKPDIKDDEKNANTTINLTQVNNDIKQITQRTSDDKTRTSEILGILAQCGALNLVKGTQYSVEDDAAATTAVAKNNGTDVAERIVEAPKPPEEPENSARAENSQILGGEEHGSSGKYPDGESVPAKVIQLKPVL